MIKSILLSRAVAPATAAFCACALAFASPASAFTPSTKAGGESTPLNLGGSTGASHSTSSGGASIVRTIVGLAIVIAVIWGLAWIMRQVKASREGGRDTNQSSAGLASVAALTLGSGRSVHLVRAGNDYVLLGATEHGVAPIHRYTEEQALDAGLLAEPGSSPEQPLERSRLATLRSQILTGVGQGSRQAQRALTDGAADDEGGIPGQREYVPRSPLAGGLETRPNPMRMPSPSSGLLERLRELTVRR
ncbi:MAG: flagellar biosynthesis protein FliO [Solirubrobacterales bacterium]|nr:flagellar biosynthesis protein FliO [Solirubrobacterales bacterium]